MSLGGAPSLGDASTMEDTAHGSGGMATRDEATRLRSARTCTRALVRGTRTRKLKKYNEGAEKVLSLFASLSPR
jgi:glutamate 5-kinase